MSMNAIKPLWLAALACGLSLGAVAHDGAPHAKAAASLKKEQKSWGIAADAAAARRTIEITMSDSMRFSPDLIEMRQGEVVRLVVKNRGKQLHEIVLGTKAELDAHAAQMVKFPNMEHDEPHMAHVKPAATGELVWHFNRAGEFDFACLIPGHYQAGMVGRIRVLAAAAAVAPAAPAPAPQSAAVAAAPQGAMSEGEVRKVDKDNRKITLKHGEIRNLDMPAMTMVFQVADAALLASLNAGDRVQFRASQDGSRFMVTEIRKMP